ncbi:CaiB/BaiF CoA transferase family protein [Roseococcus thiosulfatophilus]|uniref:CaiB/BaiF CoA transferase family protein n=1 Tax=Roseococcus thiosulfatophilus TaxID=35813 RepID=UPI0030F3B520
MSARAREETLPMDGLPVVTPGRGFALLDGIRVLDLTGSIAGPYAAMLLGDFGADVVKVERPDSPDDARGWGPPFLVEESLWFLAVNRNKRAMALASDDTATQHALIAAADVVLVSQPPRVLEKRGLSARQIHAIRPDAIHVAITGFGLTGPRADWTCYDLIAEGHAGIMDLTGAPDGPPQKVGAPAADLLAGQDAAMATLAALLDRARSGRGHAIDVSLVESMTRFLACRIVPYLGSGEVPRRSGGTDSVIAIYQAFETADHPMTLGLGSDAIWQRFWDAVGDPAAGAAEAHATNALRRADRPAIVAAIQAVLRTRPRAHWLRILAAARIPAGPINRVDEVAADPLLAERGLFFALRDGARLVPQVGTGFHLDGAANVPRRAPPRHGEHTQEVLRDWLGRN